MKLKKILSIFVLVLILSQSGSSENKYVDEKINGIPYNGIRIDINAVNTLIHPKNETRYSAKNLFDDKLSTCWATKFIKSKNYEEDISLKITFQEPIYLKSIQIYNGFQKSEELYYNNQRAKKIYIEKVIVGGRTYPFGNIIELVDKIGRQEISLEEGYTNTINLFKTEEILISIIDIYKSNKYNDLCFSEMKVNYSNAMSYKPKLTWIDLKSLIDKNKVMNSKTMTWDWDGLSANNHQYFDDLLYYVLLGNKEARLYFDKYVPVSVSKAEGINVIYKNAVESSLNRDIKQ